MTREDALANQQEIVARGYRLEHWYGTWCKKCCGVYPKFMKVNTQNPKDCYYECEVCGRRTDLYTMPWLARDAWNSDNILENQISLF